MLFRSGISGTEATAVFSQLYLAGVRGANAYSGFSHAIQNIMLPTDNASRALNTLGVNVDEIINSGGGMMDVLFSIGDALDGVDDATTRLELTQALFTQQTAFAFADELFNQRDALREIIPELYEAASAVDGTGTAFQMAAKQQDDFQAQMRHVRARLEEIKLQIADIILPYVQQFVEAIGRLVERFANLDERTQRTIIYLAAIAAAVGPLLMVFGSMITYVGRAVSIFGRMATAIGKAGGTKGLIGALGGGKAALGGFKLSLAALAGPVGWAIAALAALVVGGIALARYLRGESIPAIERFGDEVSGSTQKAVGAFKDLNDEATLALNQLKWSGTEVSEEMAASITANFQQMGDKILANMEYDHANQLQLMQNHFANSSALTEEEQLAILEQMQKGQQERRTAIEEGQARIAEIMSTASEERRALTREEQTEINQIQQQMVDTGIRYLSDGELEHKAIMERMRLNSEALSARQAAEVVQNSIAQRDGVIEAAEEQFNEVIREIIRQRDEAGTITAEQADRLIAEAQRQRDETIASAEEMHQRVVEEARNQAQNHIHQVNWETGEILTRWENFRGGVGRTWNNIRSEVSSTWDGMKARAREASSNIVSTVISSFDFLPRRMRNIGEYIIRGLWDGINGMGGWIGNHVSNFANNIADSFRRAFSISSPSRVFMEIGGYLGEGLIVGLESKENELIEVCKRIGNSIAEYLYIDPTELIGSTKETIQSMKNALPALSSNIHYVTSPQVAAKTVSSAPMHVSISGNNFYVREEADIEKVADEVKKKIDKETRYEGRPKGVVPG